MRYIDVEYLTVLFRFAIIIALREFAKFQRHATHMPGRVRRSFSSMRILQPQHAQSSSLAVIEPAPLIARDHALWHLHLADCATGFVEMA